MKRLSGSGSIRLLQKLMRKKTCSELQITSKELAHLQLQLALIKTQMNRTSTDPDVVDFNTEEPEYTKNNEIAGYYGNVSIGALEQGFQNFFPVFQENSTAEPEVPPAPVEPHPLTEAPEFVEDVEVSCGEPEKKKRKYNKKSREEMKETAEALLFLQKEAVGVPMEH